MKRALLFLLRCTVVGLFVILAGCCGPHVDIAPPPPRLVTVDKVVVASCVKATDIPAAPAKIGAQFTGDARHDLDVVARADLELRAALDKALAMLTGCEG